MFKVNFYSLIIIFIFLVSSKIEATEKDAILVNHSWSVERQVDSLCEWSWQNRAIDSRLSLEYAHQALETAEKNRNKHLICKALFHNGSAFFNSGRPQIALEYYFKARDLIDEQTTALLRARIYNGIGLASVDIAEYEDALFYYNLALDVYKSEEDREGIALQLQNIGVIYHMVGRTVDALRNYLEAVRILEQLDTVRPGILANNYLNTAIVFMQIDEHEKALYYYLKADKIYSNLGDILGLAHLYSNMGVLYFQSNLDSSLYYHKQALDFYQKLSKEISVGTSMNYVADIYRERGNYQLALSFYVDAIKILNQEGHLYGEAAGLNGLGILYRLMNNPNKSVEILTKSFEIAQRIDAMNLQIMSSKELFQTFEGMGNFKEALKYLIIHKQLSDSLFSLEKLQIIKSLEFSYETEKNQREIENLNNEKKLIRSRLYSIAILATLVVVFLLILLNRQRKIQLKEKLFAQSQKEYADEKLKSAEYEIDLRKKLLLNYALRITEKNNFLTEIQVKLKKITDVNKKNLSDIVTSIRMNLPLANEKEELENLIDKVGTVFFSKIEGISPLLTETEKRICVFLSFGFSSKDISGIMNISPKTIDNYRSSIRKKLNISDEKNLNDYLSNL